MLQFLTNAVYTGLWYVGSGEGYILEDSVDSGVTFLRFCYILVDLARLLGPWVGGQAGVRFTVI